MIAKANPQPRLLKVLRLVRHSEKLLEIDRILAERLRVRANCGMEIGVRSLRVGPNGRWGVLGALAPETTDVWIVLHGYGHLA